MTRPARPATNLEAMARAVTERVCLRASAPGEDVQAWVDRHWPIAAAYIEAGLTDEEGRPTALYSREAGRRVVLDWLARQAGD